MAGREWAGKFGEQRFCFCLFFLKDRRLHWDVPPTDVAALAVLVAGQPGVGGVVPSDHPPVVVDDSVQVVDGGLLHVVLLADAELAQVQVPEWGRRHVTRGLV